MKKRLFEPARIGVVLLLCLLFITAAILLPMSGSKAEPAPVQPATASGGLPNFDIREDAPDSLIAFRNTVGRDASAVADLRDSIVRGESGLRDRLPSVVVEYSGRLDHAEVISRNVWNDDAE